MKTEFRKKFVEALRSDDYVRATGTLCAGWSVDKKPRCCAMGVAGLLLGGECSESGGIRFPSLPLFPYKFTSRMISDVLSMAGMDYPQQSKIIDMNDVMQMSFRQIADNVEVDPFFDEPEPEPPFVDA